MASGYRSEAIFRDEDDRWMYISAFGDAGGGGALSEKDLVGSPLRRLNFSVRSRFL